jgi:hypothetical protein
MVICGSYMFERSVGKDMIREMAMGKGRDTFMSNPNCQETEN